jgi:excinuclease UvrABC ATPase subunit
VARPWLNALAGCLVDTGNTLTVIEHNLAIIKNAD